MQMKTIRVTRALDLSKESNKKESAKKRDDKYLEKQQKREAKRKEKKEQKEMLQFMEKAKKALKGNNEDVINTHHV